ERAALQLHCVFCNPLFRFGQIQCFTALPCLQQSFRYKCHALPWFSSLQILIPQGEWARIKSNLARVWKSRCQTKWRLRLELLNPIAYLCPHVCARRGKRGKQCIGRKIRQRFFLPDTMFANVQTRAKGKTENLQFGHVTLL